MAFWNNHKKDERYITDNREDLAKKVMQDSDVTRVVKGYNGKDIAFDEPVISDYPMVGLNPHYREKPNSDGINNSYDVLKHYSVAPIFQAILSTRTGQVSRFTQPINQSSDGLGYHVVLNDKSVKPTEWQLRKIKEAEHFLQYMGVNDPSSPDYKPRDDFDTFCAKLIRDTMTYDQVNAEKTFDQQGKLHHIKAVDPSTIFKAVNPETKQLVPNTYVQVYEDRVINRFTNKDMIFAVRRPRTDITSSGYGQSELEVSLKEFLSYQNTETFNDRFFSHGGSVQGVLNIKTDDGTTLGVGKSRKVLADFRRNFERRVTGISGSWQIPVTTADDVKYVNLTPNARDMEFERWLNFLINICSSVFNIDPAEIGFPNRGGATGSKSNSLNEGNQKQKLQASMNRGLSSLLRFIERTINNEIIVPYYGSNYRFEFVGEDIAGDTERVQLLEEEIKTYRTVNEVRAEKQLPPLKGGDIIMNQFAIQAYGQVLQEQQLKRQWAVQKLGLLQQSPQQDTSQGMNFQEVQSGLDGTSKESSGKSTFNQIKNGQVDNNTRTDKINYGGKPDE